MKTATKTLTFANLAEIKAKLQKEKLSINTIVVIKSQEIVQGLKENGAPQKFKIYGGTIQEENGRKFIRANAANEDGGKKKNPKMKVFLS